MSVKVSVNLPEETVETLRALAKKRGITMTEALRKAIANEKFLNDAKDEGAKILIQDEKSKDIKQLIIT